MKLLIVYNYPLHYRKSIFDLIEKSFQCIWCFGDSLGNIKSYNTANYKEVYISKTYRFINNSITWNSGHFRFLFAEKALVFGDFTSLSTIILILIRRVLRKKTFLWTHGVYGREGKIKMFIKKTVFKSCEIVFTYNKRSCKLIEELNINIRTVPIYNSLDNGELPGLFKANLKREVLNVLYLGRFTQAKKLHLIVRAREILEKQGYRINLRLVGSGEETEDLSIFCEKAVYENQEIRELFKWSDLVVSPGNIGLLALNSLRHSTPFVTHNNWLNQMPEFELMIEGKTGHTFIENDARDLARVIERKFIKQKFKSDDIRNDYLNEWNAKSQIDILKKYLLD